MWTKRSDPGIGKTDELQPSGSYMFKVTWAFIVIALIPPWWRGAKFPSPWHTHLNKNIIILFGFSPNLLSLLLCSFLTFNFYLFRRIPCSSAYKVISCDIFVEVYLIKFLYIFCGGIFPKICFVFCSLHKKWRFPWKISFVNMKKSQVSRKEGEEIYLQRNIRSS